MKKNVQSSIPETGNVVKQGASARNPFKAGSKAAKEWEKDHKMVRGRFKFHEVPGSFLKFVYTKYRGDKTTPYIMQDGQVYEVPYMVAKHLNEGGKYPVHRYAVDEEGKSLQKVGQWVDRFSFAPMGFFDDEDLQPKPNLVTVEDI